MKGHSFTRKHNGSGRNGTMTPTCSCGWEGQPVPNLDEGQWGNLRYQENHHLLAVTSRYGEWEVPRLRIRL